MAEVDDRELRARELAKQARQDLPTRELDEDEATALIASELAHNGGQDGAGLRAWLLVRALARLDVRLVETVREERQHSEH